LNLLQRMRNRLRLRIPKLKIRRPQISPRFWVAIGVGASVLILSLLLFHFFRPEESVEISYSTFIEQVRAHNVSAITIRDEQVFGFFRKPVSWPPNDPSAPVSYEEFFTIVPLRMADNRLFPALEQEDVTVTVARSLGSWHIYLLFLGGALLVPMGILLVVYRRNRALMIDLDIRRRDSQAKEASTEEVQPVEVQEEEAEIAQEIQIETAAERYDLLRPEETLAHVVGQSDAKRELSDLVAFLRNAEKYRQLRVQYPRGVLLVGPPGIGKTLLARAVAGEAGVRLFMTNLSELVELHPKVNEQPLHDLFWEAQEAAPAIIFLDEIDALNVRLPSSSGEPHGSEEQVLRQIVIEMDNLIPDRSVMVLAAARRFRDVSPILRRPGRFERQVTLSLPSRSERVELLRGQVQGVSLSEEVDLEAIGRQTMGLCGADLVLLCNRAAWLAAHGDREEVSQKDFGDALAGSILAGEVSGQLLGTEERRIAAFHESGHALLSLLLSEAAPPNKLSILPGDDWSHLTRVPISDHRLYTKSGLLARLTVILGGRTAEEIATGDVSTRAENDLEQATILARRMAARWGMSDLGPVSFHLREDQSAQGNDLTQVRDSSEASAAQVDRAVRILLEDRHAVARHILKNNRSLLDHLANLLAREETIQGEPLQRLMEKVSSVASLDEPRLRQ
jgi:cell division protease FtsH